MTRPVPNHPDAVDAFIAQRKTESPGIDTTGMAVFGRILRIAHRMAPHVEALLARHGLERGEFDVLATLQRGGPPYRLRPTEIFQTLMVSSGGLTHRLKRLEARGLIERVRDDADGRSTLVQLTAPGNRIACAAFEEDMALEAAWLAAMSQADRARLVDLLRQLAHLVPEPK